MPIKTKEVKEDQEYLNLLVTVAQDTNYFLSNKRKPERERRSCAAFLRCLGVSFTSHEITSAESAPPDVIFRSARFEVLEILDQGRKRHDEWKMELQRSKTAKALNDLLRPYKPREPLPYIEIVKLITEALAKKAVRYGYNVCANLDVLVYVNLLSNVLAPNSSIPNTEELVEQGWRSVSMIMPLYSHVFFAMDSTPGFLRDFAGQTRNECTNLDILFEL